MAALVARNLLVWLWDDSCICSILCKTNAVTMRSLVSFANYLQVQYDGTSPTGDVAGDHGRRQGVGRWSLAAAAGWLSLGLAW